MNIVVVGATGLIGRQTVARLIHLGHNVKASSRSTGVNTLTGEGVDEALAGAHVVVDTTNSPSFDDKAVMEFFDASSRNLLKASAAAGVGHFVALSVVGTDRLLEGGYFRAKLVQEDRIRASGIPYSILRATQFFEFVPAVADSFTHGHTARVTSAMVQPVASEDVARAMADLAAGPPWNATLELAGPERIGLDEWVRRYLSATEDHRHVVTDDAARYFGIHLDDTSLTPGEHPLIGAIRLDDWLSSPMEPK